MTLQYSVRENILSQPLRLLNQRLIRKGITLFKYTNAQPVVFSILVIQQPSLGT